MFIKSLVMIDEDINNTAMQVIEENIMNNVMWIKKDRSYKKHIDIYSIVGECEELCVSNNRQN